MFGIEKAVIIRTAVLILALVNTSLQLLGLDVLPFAAEDLEVGVTVLLNVVAALTAWWKDNDITKRARQRKGKV